VGFAPLEHARPGSGVPHPGQVVEGKYLLGPLLGQGGMGWVFEATHLGTDKIVALKYIKPSLRGHASLLRLLANEARAAGKIDHPNVIRIYDVGGVGSHVYIVMERLRGGNLRDRLAAGPIPVSEALQLMAAVLRGVAEAHQRKIIHRDLKPENIFLPKLADGSDDQPKVLDFGVSKNTQPVRSDAPERDSSLAFMVGTPGYMSLEQLRGDPVDERTDIYALGVVLYEMLAGRRPVEGKSREDLAAKLATESIQPPLADRSAVAVALNSIVARALARAPDHRYQDVRHFAFEVAQVATLEHATAALEPASRVSRSHFSVAIVACFVAAALAVLVSSHFALARITQLRHRAGPVPSTFAARAGAATRAGQLPVRAAAPMSPVRARGVDHALASPAQSLVVRTPRHTASPTPRRARSDITLRREEF
jgi:serine/threonine-protein kinase